MAELGSSQSINISGGNLSNVQIGGQAGEDLKTHQHQSTRPSSSSAPEQADNAKSDPWPGPSHPNSEVNRNLYISYAWGGESEALVDRLDQALQSKGLTIVRDKRDLGFKGRIQDFMVQLGQGAGIIVVLSERYLKSRNCMFELLQIAKQGQFYDRVFPIILADAKIYDPIDSLDYVLYWEEQINDLNAKLKQLHSAANLQGYREAIDHYTEIRNTIAKLTDILQDMNALTPDLHSQSGFDELFQAIAQHLKD